MRRVLAALLVLCACSAPPVEPLPYRVLDRQQSDYAHIAVVQEGPLRCLVFGRNEDKETCIDLENPDHAEFEYTRMVFVGFLFVPETENVLLVGLGGGYMPGVFRRNLVHVHLDTVELDPRVVAVARRWFDYREGPRQRTVVADGRAFLEQTEQTYDQVWLDAFGEDYIPPALSTLEFLRLVKAHLNPGGVLVENLHRTHPSYRAQLATAKAVFDHVWVFAGETSDNAVVVCGDDPRFQPGRFEESAARFNGHIGPIDLLHEADKLQSMVYIGPAKVLRDPPPRP